MINTTLQSGRIPVLITAPSSHTIGKEPLYLKTRWLTDLSKLVPLHKSYIQTVRTVAENTKTIICDLEKTFSEIPDSNLKARSFYPDGIHLTEEGNAFIADSLYDCFEKHNLF